MCKVSLPSLFNLSLNCFLFPVDAKASCFVTDLMAMIGDLDVRCDGISCIPVLQVLLILVSQPAHADKLASIAVGLSSDISVSS